MTTSGTRRTAGNQDHRDVMAALRTVGGSVRAASWSELRSTLNLGSHMSSQTLQSTVRSMKASGVANVRVVPHQGIISIKLPR